MPLQSSSSSNISPLYITAIPLLEIPSCADSVSLTLAVKANQAFGGTQDGYLQLLSNAEYKQYLILKLDCYNYLNSKRAFDNTVSAVHEKLNLDPNNPTSVDIAMLSACLRSLDPSAFILVMKNIIAIHALGLKNALEDVTVTFHDYTYERSATLDRIQFEIRGLNTQQTDALRQQFSTLFDHRSSKSTSNALGVLSCFSVVIDVNNFENAMKNFMNHPHILQTCFSEIQMYRQNRVAELQAASIFSTCSLM